MVMGHQINMAKHVAKLYKRESTIISFTNDEARGLIHSYINALVVTLNVANKRAFLILVNTKSSVDILFTFAFRQMNVGSAIPRLIKMLLYGFSGERVYAEGAMQLPVTFGQCLVQITQMVDFILIDQPSAYNAIIGRPTLSASNRLHLPPGNKVPRREPGR